MIKLLIPTPSALITDPINNSLPPLPLSEQRGKNWIQRRGAVIRGGGVFVVLKGRTFFHGFVNQFLNLNTDNFTRCNYFVLTCYSIVQDDLIFLKISLLDTPFLSHSGSHFSFYWAVPKVGIDVDINFDRIKLQCFVCPEPNLIIIIIVWAALKWEIKSSAKYLAVIATRRDLRRPELIINNQLPAPALSHRLNCNSILCWPTVIYPHSYQIYFSIHYWSQKLMDPGKHFTKKRSWWCSAVSSEQVCVGVSCRVKVWSVLWVGM